MREIPYGQNLYDFIEKSYTITYTTVAYVTVYVFGGENHMRLSDKYHTTVVWKGRSLAS